MFEARLLMNQQSQQQDYQTSSTTTLSNSTMHTVINLNDGSESTSMVVVNNSPAIAAATSSSPLQQQQQQQEKQIIYNWKETPFDPTDKRPFIRKPTGRLLTPCGLSGIKFAPPYPWIWMLPGILVPTTIFAICVPPADEVWSRVVTALGVIASLTVYLLGNFIDPTIVPPARVGDPPASNVLIHIDDVGDVQLEVCRTCKILRPPRSSHCHTSDVCLRDYDHYCGVLNHTVALKTFRWFTHFMWVTLLLVWFIAGRIVYAAAKEFDYEQMFGTNWGRFRLVCSFGLLMFMALCTCWLGGVGFMYCCHLGGKSLTLKDLKGRKSFVNAKHATWSCMNVWYRLFSCDEKHFPESVLHDDMTWIEQNKETGKVMLVGVNGVLDEDYKMPDENTSSNVNAVL